MSENTMSTSGSDASKAVAQARESLGDTLDAIEDKFNVKKRTDELTTRAKRSYEENPVPWVVGATAVAIGVVGLVTWALFGDD